MGELKHSALRGNQRQRKIGSAMPIMNTPIMGVAKVFGDSLDSLVVNLGEG
jgi:hypothetical protein